MVQPTNVTPKQLRKMFNEGDYEKRLASGKLVARIISDRHPAAPLAPVPICTKSQMLTYIDVRTGEIVAKVHRYLKKDGTLGASGRPDPKDLLHDGRLYHASKYA